MHRLINCLCRKFKTKVVFFVCIVVIAVFYFNGKGNNVDIQNIEIKRPGAINLRNIREVEDEIYTIDSPENIFGENVKVGELGEAVVLPTNISERFKILIDQGFRTHQFNQYISDIISLDRTLKDGRSDYCKNIEKSYRNLPKTSVIVIFYNEAWSTLLRSIHSILNRSPEELIEEIILVDDFSNMTHLKEPLENYIKSYPKIKLIRCKERNGLIKARMVGAKAARGPVLTFLDSHIECSKGWLEPLLHRIAKNQKSVVTPVIDIICKKTFSYKWLEPSPTGGFNWKLYFKWDQAESRPNPSLPIKSPTMAGGLFSIDKAFFKRLGMYDPDFDVWGGENLELSFKTWMCGGTLEIIPCSHVGHVFREIPYKLGTDDNVVQNNLIRLAQVWLDQYAKFYFMRTRITENQLFNVTDRKNLRENLKCHDFNWYLKNIYPLQIDPSISIGQGRIFNVENGKCIQMTDSEVKMSTCYIHSDHQYLIFTEDGKILHDKKSLSYFEGKFKYRNYLGNSTNTWNYISKSNQILHDDTKLCLSVDEKNQLMLEKCNDFSESQKWFFEFIKNVHY